MEAMMTRRISSFVNCFKVMVCAVPILGTLARPAVGSELFSESVLVPSLDITGVPNVQGWSSFRILLRDNPVLPTQDATDTNTNPYAVAGPAEVNIGPVPVGDEGDGDYVGPGPITYTGLTGVTYSGSGPINQANLPNQNLSNPTNEVQFGLTGPTDNSVMQFLGQHWGGTHPLDFNLVGYSRSVPIVTVIPNPAPPATPPPGQSFDYIVDFIQFTQFGLTDRTAIRDTEWVEFPYLPGEQPTFTYGGYASFATPIHFITSEIQLSGTQIPLDDLNFADDPPTMTTGPTGFVSEALPADIVPEPCAILLGVGSLSLLFRRRARV
jgi:hypothetical protein